MSIQISDYDGVNNEERRNRELLNDIRHKEIMAMLSNVRAHVLTSAVIIIILLVVHFFWSE